MSDDKKNKGAILSGSNDIQKYEEIRRKIRDYENELEKLKSQLINELPQGEENEKSTPGDTILEDLRKNFTNPEFHQAFYDQIPYLLWAKDLNGKFIFVNQSFARSYGKTQEEIIGRNDYDFSPEVFADKFCSDDKAVIESGMQQTFEIWVPQIEGFRWHQTIKIPLFDSKGEIFGTGGIARDITQRKNNENILKESEEKFRELAENTNDSFIIRSGQEILYVNPAFEKIYGLSRDELKKNPKLRFDRIHPDDKQRIEKIIESDEYKKSGIFSEQFKILLPDKSIKWIWQRSYPVLNDKGEAYKTISVSSDITGIKMLEDKIQNFQSQQRAILDNIPHLAWLKDMDGKYLMVNEAFCRFFDWKLEDVIGKTDFDLCPRELAEDYVKKDTEVCQKRKALRFFEVEENRFGKRFSETHKTPVINDNGDVIGVAGISRDITEQKIAEQAVVKSEEKYKGLVTLLPEIIFETNSSGLLSFANMHAFERFEYHFEDMEKGITLFDLVAPGDKARMKAAFNKTKEGKEFVAAEYMLVKKSGFEFPALFYSNSMYNEDKWSGLRCVAVDISIRKLSEKKEKAYQEKLRFLSNTALDFLSMTTDEDIYKYTGEKLKEFIQEGYVLVSSFDESKKLIEVSNFSANNEIKDAIFKKTGFKIDEFSATISNKQIEILIANSELLSVIAGGVSELSFGTIPDPLCRIIERILQVRKIYGLSLLRGGKLYGTIVILTSQEEIDDIPLIETFVYQASIALHRRQLEQELIAAKIKAEESDKLKTAFLANMSHEIRTPMNGIIGISQLLTRENIPDEERKEYLSMINANGNILINLVNDIIDISKIESNQVDLVETEFSLNKLFNELYCFILAERMTKNKDAVRLVMKLDKKDEDSFIIADKQKIQQILTNLIGNAVKFTLSGEIEFGYSIIEDKAIEFFVKDTGIGIPDEKMEFIFTRFSQADQSLTRSFGGSGLGLAISRGFVEVMKGKIWVEQRPEGGACFRFQIPFKPSEPKVVRGFILKTAPKDYDWSNYTILVVEDNYMSFRLLQALLKNSKVNVLHADDGQKAIDMVVKHPEINIVLMDIQLPVMNGYDSTVEIKKIRPGLPVIAQTANAMDDDKLKCLNSGCSDYITKPIVFSTFLNIINNYIGESN